MTGATDGYRGLIDSKVSDLNVTDTPARRMVFVLAIVAARRRPVLIAPKGAH